MSRLASALVVAGGVGALVVAVVEWLGADDWEKQNDCVAGRGGEVPSGGRMASASGDAVSLRLYTCMATYPMEPEPAGFMTTAQRDYYYDYAARWLVPCLELDQQRSLVSGFPTREQFLEPGRYELWTPYENIQVNVSHFERLMERCPPYPPGIMGR